jgi:hypothetical protein
MSAPLGEALYGRIWVTPEEYRCLPPFPTCGRPLKGSRGSRLGDGIAKPGSPLDLAPMMDVSNPGGNVDNKVLSPILRGRIGGLVRRLPPRGERREAVVFNAGRIPEPHRSFGCWETAERPGSSVRLGADDGLIKPWGNVDNKVLSPDQPRPYWRLGTPASPKGERRHSYST